MEIATANSRIVGAFDDLPPELRNRIFGLALPTGETYNLKTVVDEDDHESFAVENPPGLIGTCRQIRAETAAVFYNDNAFVVSVQGPSFTNKNLQDLQQGVKTLVNMLDKHPVKSLRLAMDTFHTRRFLMACIDLDTIVLLARLVLEDGVTITVNGETWNQLPQHNSGTGNGSSAHAATVTGHPSRMPHIEITIHARYCGPLHRIMRKISSTFIVDANLQHRLGRRCQGLYDAQTWPTCGHKPYELPRDLVVYKGNRRDPLLLCSTPSGAATASDNAYKTGESIRMNMKWAQKVTAFLLLHQADLIAEIL